jgi:hypothetical protein
MTVANENSPFRVALSAFVLFGKHKSARNTIMYRRDIFINFSPGGVQLKSQTDGFDAPPEFDVLPHDPVPGAPIANDSIAGPTDQDIIDALNDVVDAILGEAIDDLNQEPPADTASSSLPFASDTAYAAMDAISQSSNAAIDAMSRNGGPNLDAVDQALVIQAEAERVKSAITESLSPPGNIIDPNELIDDMTGFTTPVIDGVIAGSGEQDASFPAHNSDYDDDVTSTSTGSANNGTSDHQPDPIIISGGGTGADERTVTTSDKSHIGFGDNAPPYYDCDHTNGTVQPIILDLDGDGVEVGFGNPVYFDVDGDGFKEQTSWVASDDGFLVIDLIADGSRGIGDG